MDKKRKRPVPKITKPEFEQILRKVARKIRPKKQGPKPKRSK